MLVFRKILRTYKMEDLFQIFDDIFFFACYMDFFFLNLFHETFLAFVKTTELKDILFFEKL